MADRRHDCPGRCGRTVPLHLLACRHCWWLVPQDLRDRLNLTYARRERDPGAYRDARDAALDWFRTRAGTRA